MVSLTASMWVPRVKPFWRKSLFLFCGIFPPLGPIRYPGDGAGECPEGRASNRERTDAATVLG